MPTFLVKIHIHLLIRAIININYMYIVFATRHKKDKIPFTWNAVTSVPSNRKTCLLSWWWYILCKYITNKFDRVNTRDFFNKDSLDSSVILRQNQSMVVHHFLVLSFVQLWQVRFVMRFLRIATLRYFSRYDQLN